MSTETTESCAPEWLTGLRKDMATKIDAVLNTHAKWYEVAGVATDVAASYVHRAHAELADARLKISDLIAQLGAYDDVYKAGRWGLPEVLPGHIAAYRKAVLAEAQKFPGMQAFSEAVELLDQPAKSEFDACMRAGLAAVQWVPLPEPVQPSLEMRASVEMAKVPTVQARPGDSVAGKP